MQDFEFKLRAVCWTTERDASCQVECKMPVFVTASDEDDKLPVIISSNEKRLDAELQEFMTNKPDEYLLEIAKLDVWYRQRYHYLKYFMRKVYKKDEITYAETKAIFKDFYIPCGQLLLHAVCRCLDVKNRRLINFGKAKKLLQSQKPKYNYKILKTLEVPNAYYLLYMKYIPFIGEGGLPCHFETVVHWKTYVGRLSNIIQQKTGLISKDWQIYTSPSKDEKPLPRNFDLSRLKINAGLYNRPGALLLYYTGELEFMDCPFLQCDYYCYMTLASRKFQRKQQRLSGDLEQQDLSEPQLHSFRSKIDLPEVAMIQEERKRMFKKRKEKVENMTDMSDILTFDLTSKFAKSL